MTCATLGVVPKLMASQDNALVKSEGLLRRCIQYASRGCLEAMPEYRTHDVIIAGVLPVVSFD